MNKPAAVTSRHAKRLIYRAPTLRKLGKLTLKTALVDFAGMNDGGMSTMTRT